MSITPFQHPYLSGLFGDEELSALFSAEADIEAMLRFEIALAEAEAAIGVITGEEVGAIRSGIENAVLDHSALRDGVAKDGVLVPELVRQLRAAVMGEAAAKVHFGATSQDVIDTSLMLRLKTAMGLLKSRITQIIQLLEQLKERDAARSMMGYTRMQAAIPIKAGDRIDSWLLPLKRHQQRLEQLEKHGFPLQFGGAAGTLEKLGDKGASVRAKLAEKLGLSDTPQWQSQRDHLAEIGNLVSMMTGTLGKFGQDIALLAEIGDDIRMSGGGGSSAMPHKQNPVAAETLVTLARFNATQLSALHHSMVHEQERSGAAWMLEWLVLPQMIMATGVSLLTAKRLMGQIEALGR